MALVTVLNWRLCIFTDITQWRETGALTDPERDLVLESQFYTA